MEFLIFLVFEGDKKKAVDLKHQVARMFVLLKLGLNRFHFLKAESFINMFKYFGWNIF